jgi:predicted Zn-ribbon and HTH transcriptional regulator
LFEPESLQNYINILEEEADNLMDRLMDVSEEEKPFDCYKHLELASLNFILRVTAATRLESVEDPTFQSISNLSHYTLIYSGVSGDLVSYTPSLAWIDRLKGTREKMQAFINNQRDPIISKLIEEAMKKEDDSLIKELYEMKEKGTIDEDDIYVFMSKCGYTFYHTFTA